ncbi:MAG: hypothetical protein ACXWMX_04820, partial [Candidatus Limnocylindrales bacterium]
MELSAAGALDLAERLASLVVVLGTLELFAARAELRPGGTLDWRYLSRRTATNWVDRGLRARRLQGLLGYPGVLGLALVGLIGAALMAIAPREPVGPLVCLVVHVILSRRHALAADGSDDMLSVLLGVAILRTLSGDPDVQVAAAVFVAAQAALSYVTSGLSKSQSRLWWTGEGLLGTLTTETYGQPTLARFLAAHPVVTRVMGPFTIAWECLFALAILAGPIPTIGALVVAGSFHIAAAFVMGLAAFLWAFGAAFPAILFTSQWLAANVT